jgi:hypothetical protein
MIHVRHFILILLFLTGCATKPSLPRTPYQNVDISDGISRYEAQQISDNYELMFIGCGDIQNRQNETG